MTSDRDGEAADAAGWSLGRAVVKTAALSVVLVLGWLALDTGYLSPDRPTRDQWERLEKAKSAKSSEVVYKADFGREQPGPPRPGQTHWGFYNGATVSTVRYDADGVTVKYNGVPWIGAALHVAGFEPGGIYRLVFEREVMDESAAVLVRNRQMDLVREEIPEGDGTFAVEFVAPQGRRDQIVVAFIPNGRSKPHGSLRITKLRLERIKE